MRLFSDPATQRRFDACCARRQWQSAAAMAGRSEAWVRRLVNDKFDDDAPVAEAPNDDAGNTPPVMPKFEGDDIAVRASHSWVSAMRRRMTAVRYSYAALVNDVQVPYTTIYGIFDKSRPLKLSTRRDIEAAVEAAEARFAARKGGAA